MGILLQQTILPSAQRMLSYGEKLLTGISAETFCRSVNGSGSAGINHPAFSYGHLSLYPSRLAESLGIEGLPILSEHYQELFSPGAVCRDDPAGTIYPPMDEINSNFLNGYKKMLSRIEQVDDEALMIPSPNEKMRAKFPTHASLVLFLSAVHPAMHLGQVSAWRRASGLPAV